jgi:CPA2 family monovalent cation:H+ antiporter-2
VKDAVALGAELMPHDTPLIATIVVGLSLAFVLGVIAQRVGISPLVGYLLAGVAVGPFTPGFVADQALGQELAELGVILLMFGVGLHFSLTDLLSVRAIAVPGAVAQIAVATLLGLALAWTLGWSGPGGLVFGLALSVASTVVLLRAVQERRLIVTERGRIAVGWLIVEDLAMVLALVLLPALADLLSSANAPSGVKLSALLTALGITLGKVAVFIALMLIVGRRVIPWLLAHVAGSGSRELFRLAVLTIALGVAFAAAKLFDVSFALGAFFAGMVLSESELSHEAAEESLPLRDAFAVLFFVSVGMLFDPMTLLRDPLPVVGTVLIILLGKSVAAFLIVIAFRHPVTTALTISASLAQIGEFSFILAGLGMKLQLLPEQGRDLILAGAILSILMNPFAFVGIDWIERRRARRSEAIPATASPDSADDTSPSTTVLTQHSVTVGYGRVGSLIGQALKARGEAFVVIEDAPAIVARLRENDIEAFIGNGVKPDVLAAANLAEARRLFVAIPNLFEAGQIVARARHLNPNLTIVARAHSDADVEHLTSLGADAVVMGEREIARGMIDQVFRLEPTCTSVPEDQC